eukprot:TRINITY_DN60602_c0_g1_i1.p1 TRINITY_DN60602_c0_g1~~TRINITY_DN60602_c0_g1_i1.p1  ORF type:complete len:228 (+),score=50.07 TRINITY_DN60602_c0_g1_i1:114-797(+)
MAATVEAVKQFQFSAVGDQQGVIHWLGTLKGTRDWVNPSDAGEVDVRMSSCFAGNVDMLVDHTFDEQVLCTKNEVHPWMGVDLRSAVCNPSVYTFAHRAILKDFFLRSWWLEGSLDGSTWETLDERTDDATISPTCTWCAYGLNPTDKFYRYFRIRMKQRGNSRKTDILCLSCLELYGEVRVLTAAQMAACAAGGGRGRGRGRGGPVPVGGGGGVPGGPQGVRSAPY